MLTISLKGQNDKNRVVQSVHETIYMVYIHFLLKKFLVFFLQFFINGKRQAMDSYTSSMQLLFSKSSVYKVLFQKCELFTQKWPQPANSHHLSVKRFVVRSILEQANLLWKTIIRPITCFSYVLMISLAQNGRLHDKSAILFWRFL